jgi:hypothetical protein
MPAQPLPAPPFSTPFLTGQTISRVWQSWLLALWNRVGGQADKVESALTVANAAAPSTTQVIASGGLHAGGPIGGNVGLAFYVALTNVASLPTTNVNQGDFAYALDGCKAGESTGHGTGVPVWRSGSSWFAVDSGAVVSA